MEALAIVLFIVGYLAIVLEHPLRTNKAASALLTGTLCWTAYVLGHPDKAEAAHQLNEHLSEISGILFFLLGAMTI
ncbi:MAG: sodium:proton antiporter, partial [Saprospiraceae bacterium]